MSRLFTAEATYAGCRAAIDQIFELYPVQIEGKKVIVKPNALRVSTPESGIATHPGRYPGHRGEAGVYGRGKNRRRRGQVSQLLLLPRALPSSGNAISAKADG